MRQIIGSRVNPAGWVSLLTHGIFGSDKSLQGLQNQLYAFFMGFLILQPYNKQIMPFFTPQRSLYEAREGPSKIYHWSVFILAQVIVEFIWNTIGAALYYLCWYYPVGFQNNVTEDTGLRGFTTFLFIWQLILWVSTLSQAAIAPIPSADLATVPATFIGILSMSFCGIAATRDQMPAIWSDVMYYISPMTYLASGALGSTLHGVEITCTSSEIVHVPVAKGLSCEKYLGPFIQGAGGMLVNTGERGLCGWCPIRTADEFLAKFDIKYDDLWRNFGLLWAYVAFNILAALGLYYWARVPKSKGRKRT